MEINEIKEELYKYSKSYLFIESAEYISSKVEALESYNNYELLDNIFYSIDLDRLNAEVAAQLIEATKHISGKLVMRKLFLEQCKDKYSYKRDRFVGLR